MCRCHGLNLLPALVGPADAAAAARLNDGRGEYSLVGFISHMGANTACGHYVAHIRKEGRWVIYNDEKVLTEMASPVCAAALMLVLSAGARGVQVEGFV